MSHEGRNECEHKSKPTEEDLRWSKWCLWGRLEGRGCMRSSCWFSTGGAGSDSGGVCEKRPCIAPKKPPVVDTYRIAMSRRVKECIRIEAVTVQNMERCDFTI